MREARWQRAVREIRGRRDERGEERENLAEQLTSDGGRAAPLTSR